MVIAAGLILGMMLFIPRPTPHEVVLINTVEVPEVVAVEQVTPVATPIVLNYSQVYGAKPVPDIHETVDNHERPLVMLTYWELMTVLAETGFRPWVIASYYEPESQEWIQDITMQRKLYELAFCESTLNPNAVGDGGDSLGLFQINTKAWPELTEGVDLFDPELNAEVAYQIWKHSGQSFKHWSCHVTADVERRWRKQ